MGTDHGKKIKTPLRKPKVIDEIGKKKEPVFGSIEEFRKAMGVKKQKNPLRKQP